MEDKRLREEIHFFMMNTNKTMAELRETIEYDFLVMKVSVSGGVESPPIRVKVQTDISNIDEVLVIADSHITVSSGFAANVVGSTSFSIEGSEGGELGSGFSLSVGSDESTTKSRYFEPKVFKLKNNFDGTWSVLESR